MKEWSSNRITVIHVVLLMVAGFAAYSGTMHVPFYFDDYACIVQNEVVKDFGSIFHLSDYRGLGLSEDLRNNILTRFITYASFALNYQAHGLNVEGYHLVNTILHLCNALLLYRFVILTIRHLLPGNDNHGGASLAFLVAILYVVHPVQTSAVTYIVQRFAVLATFFYLATFVLYLESFTAPTRQLRNFFYLSCLITAVLGMFTKEIVFTLPVLIVFYDIAFLDGEFRDRLRRFGPLLLTMLLIPLTVVSLAMISSNTGGAVSRSLNLANYTEISQWDYFITQWRVMVTYLRILVLPLNLTLDYDYPLYTSLFDPEVMVSGLLIALLFATGLMLLFTRWRNEDLINTALLRITGFGLIWYFISFSMTSSIIPLDDLIFEYRLYLPSIGFFLAVSAFSVVVLNRTTAKFKRYPVRLAAKSAAVLMVCLLTIGTVQRNYVWQDNISFWSDEIKKSPLKARPYANLANAYLQNGDLSTSIALLEKAKGLTKNGLPQYCLGNIFISLQDFEKAAVEFEAAAMLNPENVEFQLKLAGTYLEMGRIDAALRAFHGAMRIDATIQIEQLETLTKRSSGIIGT